MAILVNEPVKCTFIHIPKTAGTSITAWLQTNFTTTQTKGKKHCTVEIAQNMLGNLGFTFCVVRNPWDLAVSWYQFSIDRAHRRIDLIEKNSNLENINKKKYNKQIALDTIEKLESLGFNNWIKQFDRKDQHHWAKDVDYVMKVENLNEDFKKIQLLLNCNQNLNYLNKSNRKHYKEYYNDESIDIVKNKWKNDIDIFGYKFD